MDLLMVGKISGTHHLKGAVKVTSSIEELDLLIGEKVMVELPNGENRVLSVESANNLSGKKWVLEFTELTNKTDADQIQGGSIKVRRDILGIGEDEYIAEDLIGMKVINEDGENLGEITDIYEIPVYNIYVVEDDRYETLIPDVDKFIKDIDFEKREMRVEILEGMREEKRVKDIDED